MTSNFCSWNVRGNHSKGQCSFPLNQFFTIDTGVYIVYFDHPPPTIIEIYFFKQANVRPPPPEKTFRVYNPKRWNFIVIYPVFDAILSFFPCNSITFFYLNLNHELFSSAAINPPPHHHHSILHDIYPCIDINNFFCFCFVDYFLYILKLILTLTILGLNTT